MVQRVAEQHNTVIVSTIIAPDSRARTKYAHGGCQVNLPKSVTLQAVIPVQACIVGSLTLQVRMRIFTAK